MLKNSTSRIFEKEMLNPHMLSKKASKYSSEPLTQSQTSDYELAIICAMARENRPMNNSEVLEKTNNLIVFATERVLDSMFPDNDMMAENLDARSSEFTRLFRQTLRNYARGTLEIPETKPMPAPTPTM